METLREACKLAAMLMIDGYIDKHESWIDQDDMIETELPDGKSIKVTIEYVDKDAPR